MKRKEINAVGITQSNDVSCFGGSSNDQKGSVHRKRAKRHSSRRVRQYLEKQLRNEKE